jgi:hypothetical protein
MLQGQADGNGDHTVTVREAVNWAQPRATDTTRGQKDPPQHPVIVGGSGDYNLAQLAAPPPPPPNNGGGGGGGGGSPPPTSPPPQCNPVTKPIIHC